MKGENTDGKKGGKQRKNWGRKKPNEIREVKLSERRDEERKKERVKERKEVGRMEKRMKKARNRERADT